MKTNSSIFNTLGIVASTIGNGITMIMVTIFFGQTEVAEFARIFLYYTLAITFIRPFFVDPLANLSKIIHFNFINFRRQAILVAIASGIVFSTVFTFLRGDSQILALLIAVLFPTLILHDIGRFYQIATGNASATAKADIFGVCHQSSY